MIYYIQANQSFSLRDIRSLFRQLTDVDMPTVWENPFQDEDFSWEDLSKSKMLDHWMNEDWWEEERQAFVELSRMIGGSDKIYLAPLKVPGQFPVEWLHLLQGLTIEPSAESFVLSPLALIWLKKVNASSLNPFPATVEMVVVDKGMALMRLTAEEKPQTLTKEQHQHQNEHLDESMVLVQANIDDSTPEWLGYVMEKLFRIGANDVNLLPVTMKKGRQANMLQVLCYQSLLDMVKHTLFTETTTFGLRYFPVTCHRLARRFHTAATPWGEVSVKLGYLSGERVQVAPEYDECAQIAAREGVPLKKVYQAAIQVASEETPERL
ncbi:nickel insertion protein [Brevibacillus ginsengisoli]|uniref:nickel insertion protein n=1 Tax=Brevibacillus ginsengisoli TaxID=363854 RepID=UPI003CF3DEEE